MSEFVDLFEREVEFRLGLEQLRFDSADFLIVPVFFLGLGLEQGILHIEFLSQCLEFPFEQTVLIVDELYLSFENFRLFVGN